MHCVEPNPRPHTWTREAPARRIAHAKVRSQKQRSTALSFTSCNNISNAIYKPHSQDTLWPLTACAPTLPIRPLVLRTDVFPSVLLLVGEDRLPTLSPPNPLPLFLPLGVFGLVGLASGSSAAFRFSTSLFSALVRPSHCVVVVVVVVQEIARRFPELRLIADGDCEALRLSMRNAWASEEESSGSIWWVERCMLTISVSGLMSNGWFSVITRRAVPKILFVFRGWPGVGAGRFSSATPMEAFMSSDDV